MFSSQEIFGSRIASSILYCMNAFPPEEAVTPKKNEGTHSFVRDFMRKSPHGQNDKGAKDIWNYIIN